MGDFPVMLDEPSTHKKPRKPYLVQ